MINAAPHLAEQAIFRIIAGRELLCRTEMNSNTITIIFVRSSVAMVNSVQICYNMIQRAFFTEPAYMQHICCVQAKQIE